MKIAITDEEDASGRIREQTLPKHARDLIFHKTLTVNKPIAETYLFWRRLENFPKFIRHLDSVIEVGGNRSHWVAGVGEKRLEWDVEMTELRENELISWESLPGSKAGSAGAVALRQASANRGTVIRLAFHYGSKFKALFGKDFAAMMEEDVYRFKSLFETGEIPTVAGQPHGNRE